MACRFYIVDVFAERRYAGNQLAVVVGTAGLSEAKMQQIAQEMNYSETTFVGSAQENDQGYEIGRPSLVLVRVRTAGGSSEVSVGGQAIPAVQGELL